MNCRMYAFLALFFSSAAFGGGDVGWIETINGDPGEVKILRNKKQVSATQFTFIQNGDELSVVSDKTNFLVTLTNGKQLRVDRSHSQVIQQAGRVPSLSWNLVRWVTSLARKEPEEQRVISAVSRGYWGKRKLTVPLLRNDASLIAGDRNFALAWNGGKAPFDVKLTQRDNKSIEAAFLQINDNHIVKRLTLLPGTYDLTVSDSTGKTWNEKSVVVESVGLPETPVELKELPGGIKHALIASWLAGVEGGRWILEAYISLAELPKRNFAEDLTLRALVEGDLPSIQ